MATWVAVVVVETADTVRAIDRVPAIDTARTADTVDAAALRRLQEIDR